MNERYLYGYGIYGIYADDELVYIGMTTTSFQDRYEHYLDDLIDCTKYRKVISYIRENREKKHIEFRILVNIKELKLTEIQKQNLSERDIQIMEMTLIHLYKPLLNSQGVVTNYPLRQSRSKKHETELNVII